MTDARKTAREFMDELEESLPALMSDPKRIEFEEKLERALTDFAYQSFEDDTKGYGKALVEARLWARDAIVALLKDRANELMRELTLLAVDVGPIDAALLELDEIAKRIRALTADQLVKK